MSDVVRELEIPELPRLQADVMQKWARMAYRKKWHDLIHYALLEAGGPPKQPLDHAAITGVRYCCGIQPDWINVVYSFKPLVDGLIKAGMIVDDNPSVLLEEHYSAVRVPHRVDQRVTLRVEGR